LSGNVGAQARLIAFGTDLLVPGPWLARFAYGAYNFHPGPPAYPGWAPASFALYDGATIFGATLHAMVERADSGAIVGTELFPISASITADHLAHQATQAMARLLRRMGPLLATHPEALPALPVEWGAQRGSKARLARLSRPDASLDAAERARRERAFTSADFVHQAALARQGPEADQPAAAAARR
jgi:methionyl-tRNA formyltransferase